MVALLAAFVPLAVLTFEYGAMLLTYWDVIQMNVLGNPFQYMFDWTFYLALFAFITTLIRELIKDIEDVEGDEQTQMKTLAVKMGIEKTTNAAVILSALTAVLLLVSALKFSLFEHNRIAILVYQIIVLIGLIVLSITKLRKAENKQQFHSISTLWKIIMLLGFGTCIISYLF